MRTLPRRFGHYQLESLLGTGGMGEVYLAEDTRRDRKVALKLLPEIYGGDDEYLNRFRRESHVAARLRDPHVIPIHDFGEIDDRLFIDMRLVDGRDIRGILDDEGTIAPARAMHLVGQIAEALDSAHAEGLVHRDVKPSNVLVTANDFVYVVDFGIARQVGPARTSLTITGTTVGSLDYMAPERFTNDPIDHRTDVYSLACLLYECLTGHRPFRGSDLPSLMYAHLFSEPPRASVTVAVPPALDAVIRRGMAKRSAARYPSAGALADAARAALQAPGGEETTTPRGARPALDTPPASGRHILPSPGPASARHVLPPPGPVSQRHVVPGPGVSGRHPVPGPGRLSARHVVPGPVSPRHGIPGAPGPVPAGASPGPPRPGTARTGPVAATTTEPVVTAPPRSRRRLAGTLVAVLTTVGALVGLATAYGLPAALRPGGPIETATSIAVPTVAGTVAVGATPGYAEVAPNGRFAYVCNGPGGVVSVLDTTLNKVTATIPVPEGPPRFVSFSPDSRTAYVSIYDADRTLNLVAFLDTATNTVTGTVPVGRRPFASSTSPDGTLLYVPSHDDGRVDVIDTGSKRLVTQIAVAPNPHWVTFSRDGRFAYTANHESNLVSVLDTTTHAILAEIEVGRSPHSTAVSPDSTRVAVVNFDSDEVSVIDTGTQAVVATVPVGDNPQDLAYAPDGRYLYVANNSSDTVSVVDTATNTITATIPSASGPTSVSVRPDGRQAYVTNVDSGTVLILDTALTDA